MGWVGVCRLLHLWFGRLSLSVIVCCFLAAGCGPVSDRAGSSGDVLIMAASSTQDVLSEAAVMFYEQTGVRVRINAGASNALAQQILAGAPADLFLSAHPAWADEVVRAGRSGGSTNLLSGKLVLAVPVGNPAAISGPEDLLASRVRRLALAGEHVPAGMYAQEVLAAYGVLDDLLTGGRIVRGQNVRFTLAYVERGEVDAGIVYASDAAISSKVEVIYTFGSGDHEAIVFPLLLLDRGWQNPSAVKFFEFLQSSKLDAVFDRHGFGRELGPASVEESADE